MAEESEGRIVMANPLDSRAAAMMAIILRVYDCGKSKDKQGKLKNWGLKAHAEKELRERGVEGLLTYYNRCLNMTDPRGDLIQNTLRSYGCETLESVKAEFMTAYQGKAK